MEISKADQITLDDALVAPANRLKIGKCNLRLSSDVTSKEATLQVVYDVLKLTPLYKHSKSRLMFLRSTYSVLASCFTCITDLSIQVEQQKHILLSSIQFRRSYFTFSLKSRIKIVHYEGNWFVLPGVPNAPDYDSNDDISWKSSKNDQDEDKNEDDENVQDDVDDAKSGDDELKSQDDLR
ncbi:hypothetical protein Tco_1548486 [Tanacetum coccineum]